MYIQYVLLQKPYILETYLRLNASTPLFLRHHVLTSPAAATCSWAGQTASRVTATLSPAPPPPPPRPAQPASHCVPVNLVFGALLTQPARRAAGQPEDGCCVLTASLSAEPSATGGRTLIGFIVVEAKVVFISPKNLLGNIACWFLVT